MSIERWPALSLREPWLTAVLDLGKRIENRRWNTSVRGRFWLHAAKAMTKREYQEGCDYIETQAGVAPPGRPQLRSQGIAGMATLVDVISPDTTPILKTLTGIDEDHLDAWWMPWQYGFILTNVVRLREVIPCNGSLGFFHLPPDVERRAREALET